AVGLTLVSKTVNVADDADLFAGVVYKLPDVAQLDSSLGSDLNALEQKVVEIRQKVNLMKPGDIVPDLAAALKQLQSIRARSANEQVQFLLQQKEEDFHEALRLAAGLVF